MDPEEITKLCEQLRLDLEESVVPMTESESEAGFAKLATCLVGKVIGNRNTNKEGLESVFRFIWKTRYSFQIEPKGINNIFLFQFGSVEDMKMVLNGGPWLFNKQVISLARPVGAGDISAIDFNVIPFWIHLLNLPLRRQNGRPISSTTNTNSPQHSSEHSVSKRERGNGVTQPVNNQVEDNSSESGHNMQKVQRHRYFLHQLCVCMVAHRKGGKGRRARHIQPEKERNGGLCSAESPNSMSCLCWNVQGLGNPCTVKSLQALVGKVSPDLVFLSETRLFGAKAANIRYLLNFGGNFVVDCQGKSGGLMLLWSDNWEVEIISYSAAHIHAHIKDHNNKCWRFTGVYGQPRMENRHHTWELIKRLQPLSNLPWLCGGDFSETILLSEQKGGSFRNQATSRDFQMTLNHCNLLNFHFQGRRFTWNNKRKGTENIQARLDRFVATEEWQNEFPEAWIEHLPFQFSDHRPIILHHDNHLKFQGPQKIRPFRFEPFWLREKSLCAVVREGWEEEHALESNRDTPSYFIRKLTACSKKLKEWSKQNFVGWRKKLRENEKRLQELYDSPNSENLMEDIHILEQEVHQLLAREEIFWKQRARVDWLKEGDRNTRFFHNRAKERFRRNRIDRIQNDQGAWLTNEEEIVRQVTTFFHHLFSSRRPTEEKIRLITENVGCGISSDEACLLDAPFTEKDVLDALMSIDPYKAPGADGFHAIFYQKYWELIKNDVTSVCLNILNNGYSMQGLNDTVIALIPKKKNPVRVIDYRPISLCTVLYKIISKAIASRLKVVLDPLISANQSAFVPNRLITDNAILAFELLH
ncbi:Unknown protein [Striga hermonthica]|uniref:Reverse transcriptase domain-containing protein n=1 Tax=Striga hermonthica TaxID=68872 RepID=A0A9N7MRR2_STRHE|nr:Unknown protein [Striga hermonthica]